MVTISDQVLELGGWKTAWKTELRDEKGRWAKRAEAETAQLKTLTGHVEVPIKTEASKSGKKAAAETAAARKKAAAETAAALAKVKKDTPSGTLHEQISSIEAQESRALARLGTPSRFTPLAPSTETILKQESPAPGSGQQFGPMRMAVAQAIPAIDHRMITAYSANARNAISRAVQNNELTSDQAKSIGESVDSLVKVAQAADRQIQQLQDAQNRTQGRLDALEQAIRDLNARQEAGLNNERIKDRIIAIRQKHSELMAEARDNAAGRGRTLIGVGAALSNLALTISGFLGLPGGLPVSGHEWMLAIIPVAAAVGVTFVQPLYERYQEKRLAAKADKLRRQEAAAELQAGHGSVPPEIQAHSNIMQFAAGIQEDWAIQWLSGIFAQCGLSGTQADELAQDLIETR